jgi:Beta propeller domain
MKRAFVLVPAVALAFASGACSSWEDDNAEYQQCLATETKAVYASRAVPAVGGLVEIDEADQVAAVREKLKADMRAALLDYRANAVARARCEDKDPGPRRSGFLGLGSSSDDSMAVADSASGGASQVSGTNNQVAGVDEADFVKNDTKYIYVANGSRFRIVEAWPAESAHEIASVAVEGVAKKLFVHGDRAVVYSSLGTSANGAYNPYAGSECTYGYDCSFGGDGTPTLISIFDLTDRATPKLLRTIKSSSSLVAARRVGDAIHTVLTQQAASDFRRRSFEYPSVAGDDEAAIHRACDKVEARNDAKIDALPLDVLVPTLEVSAGAAGKPRMFRSGGGGGASFTSVLSLDLRNEDMGLVSVLANPGAVYGSAEALYMASPANVYGFSWLAAANDRSTIHKFGLGATATATAYRGSGEIDGHVLSQLSMDENDGKLRVATSVGHVPDPAVHSVMSVLEEQQGMLATLGKVDNIAPGEDIRSVRFDGGRGFIVTFKKTDPLFAFDLSNPSAPRITGELKIPGFSTYMHMMDATHLLTIGYDAADHGNFAFFTGVLLQIFDIADPTQPQLVHKEVIGTRGSSSEALTNHLAFTYFAPKNLLALPMSICEGGDENGGYGSKQTFSGLMVFDVTAAGGFALRGRVSHPASSTQGSYYGGGCYNWWSDASSEVKRSIVMDDWIFSISSSRIKVSSLAALDQNAGEISIGDPSAAAQQ